MIVPYLFINIIALLFFSLLFIAFMAAAKSREINSWIMLLGSMVLWALGSVFMRKNVYPGISFWFYVSMLSLFTIPFFAYNYVFLLADEKEKTFRAMWLVGTVLLLISASTGLYLAPPEMSVNAKGLVVFNYDIKWTVVIPIIFIVMEIVSVANLFNRIISKNGSGAPGVKELIIGCALLTVGNSLKLLPGKTFPFDALSGILFAVLIVLSLNKRRVYDNTLVISKSILVVLSAGLMVLCAAYFFPMLNQFFEDTGGSIASSEVETNVVLSAVLLLGIGAFRKLLSLIFSEREHYDELINKYSEVISQTLDIESIIRETVSVICSELRTNSAYICLLKDNYYETALDSERYDQPCFKISKDHACVKFLEDGGNNLVIKDFEKNPGYKAMDNSAKELLKEYGIACVSALRENNSVNGLILLTEKGNALDYNYGDLSFVSTVASIASIAIKNAKLYQQVAEREHMFSSMTGFIPNAIFIKTVSKEGFSFVSSNTERVIGLPAEYFTQRKARDVIHTLFDEKNADEIYAFIEKGGEGVHYCDTTFVTPSDHREITVRCAFLPIVSDGKISHHVCVVSDITEDIQAQTLLKTSVELAQSSNRAKSDFLSHMSHEIRTPMNSIAGMTYLARELVTPEEQPELCGYLDKLDQSSQYLISILNNIMDISKIESNKYELRSGEFEMTDVINELYSVYKAQMSAKNVEFLLDTSELRSTRLIGDEISLRKILNNLLSNAYKFTPGGGQVRLKASQLQKSRKSITVKLVVSDTGIGMSSDFIDKLFEPYAQELKENVSEAAGSGLGMAICKSLIDFQGGTIKAQSTLGEGTSFTVELPYALAEQESGSDGGTPTDLTVLRGRHFMVVDDVAVNTVITGKLLEKHQVLVDYANNGKSAVELFESKPDGYYNCILMDIQMPVMDGIEASAEIRKSQKSYAAEVPILAMTADAFLNDSSFDTMADFNGYILKPVSPDVLYGRLAALFAN